MKKLLFIITSYLISINSFSQIKDSTRYKFAFTINLESIYMYDIKLTSLFKIKTNNYFELMLSYNFPNNGLGKGSINNPNAYIVLRDPYNYYGRYQVRMGMRQYLSKRFYLCELLSFGHGKFENKVIVYSPKGGSYYNVNRIKNDYEIMIKSGWTFNKEKFISDLYVGFGCRFKYLNDNVNSGYDKEHDFIGPYPYNKNYNYSILIFHLGFQIGYCK